MLRTLLPFCLQTLYSQPIFPCPLPLFAPRPYLQLVTSSHAANRPISFWIPIQVLALPSTLSPGQKSGAYPRFLFSLLLLHLTHLKLFFLLLLSLLLQVCRSSSQGPWIITVFGGSSLTQGSPPASFHTVTRMSILK